MGSDPTREPPFFFQKPSDAIQFVAPGTTADHPYPTLTKNYHYEIELVAALDKGGRNVSAEQALDLVFGYTVGLDLTRRDLQAAAKAKGLPWDTAKGFDHSAPIGPLVPAAEAGDIDTRSLWLRVNGELRQQAPLTDLIWDVADILHELSKLYALRAGDLVFMGTPAGVAALQPGDGFEASLDGIATLRGRID
jgi:2-keto-4-pentenoate hydratase/2-oxohepta-3-ene-1,7-dioic acid hydratase in catechol pathway